MHTTMLHRSSLHLSCRTSRCPSAGRSANWAIMASLTSSYGSCIRACNGSACRYRKMPMASRPSTTRRSTASSRNGPMMGHCGRPSSPVWRISPPRSTSTSAYSMATGPPPWPKKGRWDWLLGPQTSEGGESHRHHRQSWLRLSAGPRGSCQ
jgi:hypothetical protein